MSTSRSRRTSGRTPRWAMVFAASLAVFATQFAIAAGAGAETDIATTTTFGFTPTSPVYGDPITLTALVSHPAGPVTSGTITFSIDGQPIGTASPDASGFALLTISTLRPGSHSASASYSGAGYASSVSPMGSIAVSEGRLRVIASYGSSPYGTEPGPVTPIYDGFVNGDDASSLILRPTCGTTATSTSAVGDYPATCGGGVDDEYSLYYVPASWTVTPAPVGLTTSATNGLISLLASRITYTTTATNLGTNAPVAGLRVTITIYGKPQCAATTDPDGVATCTTGFFSTVMRPPRYSYTASTPGDQNHQAASTTGLATMFGN